MTRIAMSYGFADWRPVWNAPENASLRSIRDSPDVLMPGDSLFIPDKLTKELPAGTEQKHPYEVTVKPLRLRVKILDRFHEALALADGKIQIGADVEDAAPDGSADVDQPLNRPQRTEEAGTLRFNETLEVNQQELVRDLDLGLKIGYMDPAEEESGQLKRLRNLGYYALPEGQPDDKLLQAAIEEFQCENSLTVDGICGPQTQAKLKEVYGC